MKTRLMFAVAALVVFGTTSARAEPDKKIERIFKSKCAACHGVDGKGKTEKGLKLKLPDMTSADFKAKPVDEMKKTITEGLKIEKDGVKKEMDSFKDELKPAEIDGLIEYVKSLK